MLVKPDSWSCSAVTTSTGLGVSVSVADGKVTLAGTTSSGSVRQRAEKIAHDVAGMRQVDNRIVSVPSRGSAFTAQP